MTKKVLGVYESSDEVIRAIEELRNEGYSVNDLSIVSNTRDFSSVQYETGVGSEDIDETHEHEHKGFLDSLVSAFEGNNNTDENTTYYDHLVGAGIDETAAREYENAINSGKILLLADNGPETMTGYSIDTPANDRTDMNADRLDTDKERSLKLREEQLDVSKDRVQTGEVGVHKDVVEEQKTVHVPVTHEEVYVERRPVDDSSADTAPIGDEETIRVPIVEEKVEVTKKPVVSEEIVIGKKQVTETEQVTENVKREEARIEKDGDVKVDETDVDRSRRYNDGRL